MATFTIDGTGPAVLSGEPSYPSLHPPRLARSKRSPRTSAIRPLGNRAGRQILKVNVHAIVHPLQNSVDCTLGSNRWDWFLRVQRWGSGDIWRPTQWRSPRVLKEVISKLTLSAVRRKGGGLSSAEDGSGVQLPLLNPVPGLVAGQICGGLRFAR